MKFIVLDIETENTGYDIMNDNKRILSIQLFDGNTSSLYYDQSESNNLERAIQVLKEKISENIHFVGFNIRNFDVFFIKKFLGVDIPEHLIIDIGDLSALDPIRKNLGKRYPRLFEICDHLNIDCSHKSLMDKLAQNFLDNPEVISAAKEGAQKLVSEKGWSYNFSYNLSRNRIAGGMAILESYNDFIKSNDVNSLFYKYAMGDVFTEYELFKHLDMQTTQ